MSSQLFKRTERFGWASPRWCLDWTCGGRGGRASGRFLPAKAEGCFLNKKCVAKTVEMCCKMCFNKTTVSIVAKNMVLLKLLNNFRVKNCCTNNSCVTFCHYICSTQIPINESPGEDKILEPHPTRRVLMPSQSAAPGLSRPSSTPRDATRPKSGVTKNGMKIT